MIIINITPGTSTMKVYPSVKEYSAPLLNEIIENSNKPTMVDQGSNNNNPITPRSRPPVGIVQRMARERESVDNGPQSNVQKIAQQMEDSARSVIGNNNSNSSTASPSNHAASVGRDAATIHRVKLAKGKHRRAKMQQAGGGLPSGSSSSSISSVGNMNQAVDKYAGNTTVKEGDDQSANSSVNGGGSILKAAQSYISSGVHTNATSNNSGASYHIGLPSLLTDGDDATIDSSYEHNEIMETELYQKFEEAFNVTLRNNPGILPGAPTVIDSIKQSLYKVQKAKVKKEKEMRKQLDKVKAEKDQLEQQLRKEMGTMALRRNELSKDLEGITSEKDLLQDSLKKQSDAVTAVKKELKAKMSNITKEKEELTKHLGFLSKSRAELEKALEIEMKAVEKDRDALKDVVTERKKLQKQKNENKDLESKIERMTQAASKEKKALQSEVADLKKFEQHVAKLREAHETSRQELENEKKKLKEVAATMQTKKSMLIESLKELEIQYKLEIEELEEQIGSTTLMHERNMENVVKGKVMRMLGRDCGGGGGGEGGGPRSSKQDMETIINERVEAELKKKMGGDIGIDDPKENRNYSSKSEGRMRREIERLREELELVQARNNAKQDARNPTQDVREDIGTLRDRDEMRYSSSTPAAGGSTPGSRTRSTLRSREALISPRYGDSLGLGGVGGGYGRYSEDSEDDRLLMGAGGRSDPYQYSRLRDRLTTTPPLSQRSPRTGRRFPIGGVGGGSRYYF